MTQEIEQHYTAYLQPWTESERGWGSRPDGHTLHATLEARNAFVKKDHDDTRAKHGSEAPDCYSFADGEPRLVRITKDAAERLARAIDGIWVTKGDIIK